jgi:hypothetical protein
MGIYDGAGLESQNLEAGSPRTMIILDMNLTAPQPLGGGIAFQVHFERKIFRVELVD